jgi:hypothetical protein
LIVVALNNCAAAESNVIIILIMVEAAATSLLQYAINTVKARMIVRQFSLPPDVSFAHT